MNLPVSIAGNDDAGRIRPAYCDGMKCKVCDYFNIDAGNVCA